MLSVLTASFSLKRSRARQKARRGFLKSHSEKSQVRSSGRTAGFCVKRFNELFLQDTELGSFRSAAAELHIKGIKHDPARDRLDTCGNTITSAGGNPC